MSLVSQLGYPVETRLKALLLPKYHGLNALLLEEQIDSVTSNLYLYSLDSEYRPIDHLCLYEERPEDRAEDFGRQFTDYYITSGYEVTILYIYESLRTQKSEAEQTRRFLLTTDGRFEEVVIEIE
jgi:hypothetical protein